MIALESVLRSLHSVLPWAAMPLTRRSSRLLKLTARNASEMRVSFKKQYGKKKLSERFVKLVCIEFKEAGSTDQET